MPQKTKYYRRTKFAPDLMKSALAVYEACVSEEDLRYAPSVHLRVGIGTEEWQFDSLDEFFADYRRDIRSGYLSKTNYLASFSCGFYDDPDEPPPHATVTVRLRERAQVERVFEMFEAGLKDSRLPLRVIQPRIFIGHGRNSQWRDLADHLREQHKLKVISFESGPRAGRMTKDVLEELSADASFAILVHTAEDEQEDATVRARQNVVHETGWFQGKLGFDRAIILREEGCEPFTNVAGDQEIRYSKGNIRETFGDVLATINREFPRS